MPRRTLLDALNSPLPLLFVEAPPGAGKRTLLEQWVHDRGRERRVVVRVERTNTSGSGLLRLIWSALGHSEDGALPQLPASDDDVVEEAVRRLAEVKQPAAVAILAADHLAADGFDLMLEVLRAGVGLRLVVAAFDASALMDAANRRGIPFGHLDDQDMRLTLDETRTMMLDAGLEPTAEAVAAMHEGTTGHPGMIGAAIAMFPAESEVGRITSDKALGAFLTTARLGDWPTSFADSFQALVWVPRFSAAEAEIVTDAGSAEPLMHRLQTLGLGEMVYHPGMRQRVFRWHEPLRMVVLQCFVQLRTPVDGPFDRITEAAERCDDRDLLVAMLVRKGELDRAEQVLDQWLWDALPNVGEPLWQQLESISPLALLDHPGLLCVRLRLASGSLRSTASAKAAVRTGRRVAAAATADPWRRLAGLARALELARHPDAHAPLVDLVVRARGLAADLIGADVADAVTPGGVSDLLLVAETIFRMGDIRAAAEFAGYAAQLIEHDPGRLDPAGERRPFAERLMLLSHRERGLDDPVDAEVLLSGLQFLWRDADVMAAYLAVMSADLDAGDLAAADARGRVVLDLVEGAAQWPALLYARVWLLALRRGVRELRPVLDQYEAIVRSAASPVSRAHEFARAHLALLAGREVAHPAFVPLPPAALGGSSWPRIDHGRQLHEALTALRAGQRSVARACLERAALFLPRRGLSSLVLAVATTDEVADLAALVADHPDAPRLRLEQAFDVARKAGDPVGELSEREHEVLRFLRAGATNKAMAQAMFVSVNTVKFHRANLMRKLGASNRDEVLEAAARLGL